MKKEPPLGRWVAPGAGPRAAAAWEWIPSRTHIAKIEGRQVAVVSRDLGSKAWIARAPGFLWDLSEGRGTAWQAAQGMTEAPERHFKTSAAARWAVNEALKLRDNGVQSGSAP